MNPMLTELQRFLNAHGASLAVDGMAGPATRAAIFDTFRNTNAAKANRADLALIASRLGVETAQIIAVGEVESAGGGWDRSGLLTCLYERHKAFKAIGLSLAAKGVPGFLSMAKPGGYTIDADSDGINDSWEKIAEAAMKQGGRAFEWASWGKFQVMGFHWQALGYSSPLDMVWKLSRDEAAHYDCMARFVQANGLRSAMGAITGNPETCRAFAKGYNGVGYRKNAYHEKIAAAYRRAA